MIAEAAAMIYLSNGNRRKGKKMSIVVQDVTKLYGEQKALDNVSFRVETGTIVGFLGPNGAGKSTMMKIITGFIPPTSGRVYVNDQLAGSDNIEVKKQIGYLPENNPLYPEMYVREYLGFVASVYKTGIPQKKLVDDIVEITGLVPEQKKKIGALSKGYRQRVGLAQALIHDPEVLILDEATSGLDPNQIVDIRNLIREAGRAKTVLLSTHIMQEVEAICDRVIIINKGVIVADEEKNNMYTKFRHPVRTVMVEFDKQVDEKNLTAINNVTRAKNIRNNIWLLEAGNNEDIRPAVFQFAVGKSLMVLSLQEQESNLEEV
ncbi:MAG TPA: gliding motility-associated ABC transporter ATP-binding subunit GldA, partial [Bacteroidales bacterium]|nr:gliding motility-associated ABC transporter ATP-binding subunit GldA [Bacteroidales bacterium]